MSKIVPLAAAALAVFAASAATVLAPNAPLIADGPVVVDASDFEGNMLRVPPDRRVELRTSYDRVLNIVDNMFVSRSLAQRARAEGLDKDPAVQKRLQQVQDGVLADLYMQKVEREVVGVNLEQRARELYRAEQAKYMTPEEVHVQHILVNLSGRTRDTAQERARKAADEARAGEDFLTLATRYSDDPDKKRNGGDLGYNAPNSFTEPVRKAIAAMKTKGEIAGPIESEYGFHIVRFVDRRVPRPIPFEAVAKRIVDAERERLAKARRDAVIQDIRSTSTVTVHRGNIEKLVYQIDPESLRKAVEAASASK